MVSISRANWTKLLLKAESEKNYLLTRGKEQQGVNDMSAKRQK